MKILYCLPDISNSGGIERLLEVKIDYFIKNFNYDITILTWEQKKEIFYKFDKRVKILNMDAKIHKSSLKRQLEKIKKIKEMRKILRDGKYDYVISCHFPLDLFIDLFKKYSFFIREIHISKESMYKNLSFKQRCFVEFENRYILKKFDKVITLTKADMEEWKLKNIDYIYNPLTFWPKTVSKCENKKIISIGRLEKQKGFDILIDICSNILKTHSDWQLNIYGEGSERKNLEEQIKKLKLDKNIFLKGNSSDIENKLLESSIYIMSSRYEGFPLVLLEAQSCGLPIVSFDCPHGPREIIKNKDNGFLCKNGDRLEMRERILELIESESKRKKIGKKAREDVKIFSKKNILNRWKEFFEENVRN